MLYFLSLAGEDSLLSIVTNVKSLSDTGNLKVQKQILQPEGDFRGVPEPRDDDDGNDDDIVIAML